MSSEELIEIIASNFLCVRRLPFEVISYWSYREGDENKKWVDCNGNPSKAIKSLFVREDGKKLLKEERQVSSGGWWYVKVVKDTGSIVRFNREYDKFFAPTLEKAVQLYLNSKKINETN